jgi:hypothetical protein
VLSLTNCTLSANHAQGGNGYSDGGGGSGYGGAIFNLNGVIALNSCTIASNSTASGHSYYQSSGGSEGGGLYNLAYGNKIEDGSVSVAVVTLVNTILAGSNDSTNDLVNHRINGVHTNTATVVFAGNNLVMSRADLAGATSVGAPSLTADPMLGPLANNGGLTLTMALLPGSPAIDQGSAGGSPGTDQRGVLRPQGAATDLGAFEFTKLAGTVVLGNLSHTYDGTPKSASATTTPPSLAVTFTYNGLPNAPVNAGSYTVVGTINDANYQGAATNTLIINKAAATVTLGNLSHTYDGAPKSASASTTPSGLTVHLTYDGVLDPPANVGDYTVVGLIDHPDYFGSATNILRITAVPPRILVQPEDQSVLVGGTAQFDVVADGTPPLSYQWWSLSSGLLSDATNSTLLLTNVQPTAETYYRVEVSNVAGTTLSLPALLSVEERPLLLRSPAVTDGVFMFEASVVPGQAYAVEASTNLTDWILLLTTNATADSVAFNQTEPYQHLQRFYRVRIWP